MKYRNVEVGELILEGDEAYYREDGSWIPVSGSIGATRTETHWKMRRLISSDDLEQMNVVKELISRIEALEARVAELEEDAEGMSALTNPVRDCRNRKRRLATERTSNWSLA